MPRKQGEAPVMIDGIPQMSHVPSTTPYVADQKTQPVTFDEDGIPIMRNTNPGSAGQFATVNPDVWKEYTRMTDKPFLGDPRMADMNSLQSGGEMAWNAVAGMATNAVGGALTGLAGWDFTDTYDMVAGNHREYGNWLQDIADDITKYSAEKFPIYEKVQGGFNPADPAWWGKQAQGLGTTIGFFAEGFAEQALFAALTGGTMNEVSLATKMRAIANLTRAAAKTAAKETAWGMFKGIQEATTNGYETYSNAKQRYDKMGYSDEESTQLAAMAASVGFRTEAIPLMAMNALQFATMARNPVTGKSYSALLEGIEHGGMRNLAKYGTEVLSEAAEEGWQTIAGMEGQYKSDLKAGLIERDEETTFGQRMGEYMKSAEVWNAAVGGALGGGMFTVVGGAKNKIIDMLGGNQQEKSWDNYKKGLQGMNLEYIELIKKAEADGRVADATALKQEMSMVTALNAYHIDHLKNDQQRSTYQANDAILNGILTAANTGDLETLKNFKLTDADIPFIQKTFPQMIEDSKAVKDIYDKIKGTNDSHVLVPIAFRTRQVDNLGKSIDEDYESLHQAYADVPGMYGMSVTGRNLMRAQYRYAALEAEKELVENDLKTTSLGQDHKDNLQKRLSNIEREQESIAEDIDQEQKDQRENNPDEYENDNLIRESLPKKLNDVAFLNRKIVNDETQMLLRRRELALLKDVEYQAKMANEETNRQIRNAKTQKQLKDLKKELEKKKKLDEKAERKLRKKEKDIKGKDTGKQQSNATPKPNAAPASSPPDNAGKRSTAAQPQGSPSPNRPFVNDPANPTAGEQAPAINIPGAPSLSTVPGSQPGAAPAPRPAPAHTQRGDSASQAEANNATGSVNSNPTVVNPTTPGPTDPSIPTQIDEVTKHKLRLNKYTNAEINQMTPAEAHTKLQEIEIRKQLSRKGVIPPDKNATGAGWGKGQDPTRQAMAGSMDIGQTKQAGPDSKPHVHLSPEFNPQDEEAAAARLDLAGERVKAWVERMAETEGITPEELDYEDFIIDLVLHTDRNMVMRNLHMYEAGWDRNGYKTANFEDVYKAIFKDDRAGMGMDIVRMGDSDLGADLNKQMKEVEDMVGVSTDPIVYVMESDGTQVAMKSDKRKTTTPVLRMFFKNLDFEDIVEVDPVTKQEVVRRIDKQEIWAGTDIDSAATLDYNKFYAGYGMHTYQHPNPYGVYVTAWSNNYSQKDRMTFADWCAAEDVEEGSRRWIGKVPILIYDGNNPVGFIPDIDQYNHTNVGHEGDPAQQVALINEARARLMALRTHVLEQGSKGVALTVTHRGNGNIVKQPEGRSVTLAESDPHAPVGYKVDDRTFHTSIGEIDERQIIESQTGTDTESKFNIGEPVELRQCGVVKMKMPDGTEKLMPQYMLMKVWRPEQLDADAYHSVKWALKAYLGRDDSSGRIIDSKLRDDIRNAILDLTRLDIYDFKDLDIYLKQFISTVDGETQYVDDEGNATPSEANFDASHSWIHNKVETTGSWKKGSTYISIQNGNVILGVKGYKVTDKTGVLWAGPHTQRKDTPANMQKEGLESIEEFFRLLDSVGTPEKPQRPLSQMRLNISNRIKPPRAGIHNKVALISETGEVRDGGLYKDFTRQRNMTNLKAFDIGTKDNPQVISFVQPTIEFKYEGEEAKNAEQRKIMAQTAAKTNALAKPPVKPVVVTRDIMKEREAMEVNGLSDISQVPGSPNQFRVAWKDGYGNTYRATFDENGLGQKYWTVGITYSDGFTQLMEGSRRSHQHMVEKHVPPELMEIIENITAFDDADAQEDYIRSAMQPYLNLFSAAPADDSATSLEPTEEQLNKVAEGKMLHDVPYLIETWQSVVNGEPRQYQKHFIGGEGLGVWKYKPGTQQPDGSFQFSGETVIPQGASTGFLESQFPGSERIGSQIGPREALTAKSKEILAKRKQSEKPSAAAQMTGFTLGEANASGLQSIIFDNQPGFDKAYITVAKNSAGKDVWTAKMSLKSDGVSLTSNISAEDAAQKLMESLNKEIESDSYLAKAMAKEGYDVNAKSKVNQEGEAQGEGTGTEGEGTESEGEGEGEGDLPPAGNTGEEGTFDENDDEYDDDYESYATGGMHRLPEYNLVTDKFMDEVIEDMYRVEGMSATSTANVTTFLARKIEGQIDTHHASRVSMETIDESLKAVFQTHVANRKAKFAKDRARFEKDHLAGDPNAMKKLSGLGRLEAMVETVEQNWDTLTEKALQKVMANTGITKVTRTAREYAEDMLDAVDALEISIPDTDREVLQKASNGDKKSYPAALKLYKQYEDTIREALDEEGRDALDFELEELELSMDELNSDDGGERARDFSKTSLQENNKTSVSYRFRRLMNQIPAYEPGSGKNGNTPVTKKGFAGVELYPGYGYYFDRVMQFLVNPVPCYPDYDHMLQRLQQTLDKSEGTLPWLAFFIEKLKNSDDQMKEDFVYGFSLNSANFKMLLTSTERGEDRAKVIDTNSGEIDRVIIDQWYQNFLISDLVDDTGTLLNVKVAKELLDDFASWKPYPTQEQAQKWLEKVGIVLSSDAMNEIYRVGYTVKEKSKAGRRVIKEDFKTHPHSIFRKIAEQLGTVVKQAEEMKRQGAPQSQIDDYLRITDVKMASANPLNNVTNIMKRVANVEKKFTNKTPSTSIRDGSKTRYGLTVQSLASQRQLDLKTNEGFRKQLQSVAFNGGSFILDMLNVYDDFRDKFTLEHLGNNTIKEQGTRNFKDTDITSLSETDQEAVRVNFMADLSQGTIDNKTEAMPVVVYGREHWLRMRIGRMLFPTMSDKEDMKDTATAVINMKRGTELVQNADGTMSLSSQMLSFAFSQLIEPEFRRIIQHHQLAKSKNVHPNNVTNIEGYNKAAQIFLGIPAMNDVTIGDQGVTLIQYIAQNIDNFGKIDPSNNENDHYNHVLSEIREQTDKLLQDFFAEKVQTKIGTPTNAGTWTPFMEKDKNGRVIGTNTIDSRYLSEINKQGYQDNTLKVLTHAAYEYVFNTHIHNANHMMMYGSDLAFFSQDAAFKNDETNPSYEVDGNGETLVYMPINKDALMYAVSDVIDTNLGKRLAMLMTPGKPLSGSHKNNYVQLCIRDRISMADSIRYLIDITYGKAAGKEDPFTAEVEKLLDMVLNGKENGKSDKQGTEIARARKALQKKFPAVAEFFNIKSTDGQEYVTVLEAIDTIWHQGRCTKEDHERISTKAMAGERLDPKDIEIIRRIMLNPTKPVATGITYTEDHGAPLAVPRYIKCSAIPLIDTTTNGSGLGKLQKVVEEIQKKSGMNVRVAYGSAIKVGNVLPANQLQIWDNQGNYIDGSIQADTIVSQIKGASPKNNILIMNRPDFKIQQDVPYDENKKTVTLVSQAMKALFGDGILDEIMTTYNEDGSIKTDNNIFSLNGNMVDAPYMYEHMTQAMKAYIANEKSILYKQLGISEKDGKPSNKAYTARQVEKIMKREALARKYAQSAIDGIKLHEDGAFTLPVWLSPDHHKYESLLNSIVVSRLVRLKFPGKQLVAASEEGFNFDTLEVGATEAQIKAAMPGVVFTPHWKGSLKAAQYDENGNFIRAQCFMQSQFRNAEGKLIDLVKEGYIKEVDGKMMLDMNKIDPELLSVSSFRVPVSGHVSMSQLEIVGFLPPEQGDLIIVPKNMTKQKGLDFDIDKESLYQLWQTVDKSGKIATATRENMPKNKKTVSKLQQNEVIKVYHAFLGNSDPRIQKRINKVMSLDFEREQREKFMNYAPGKSKFFSIYDDEHQKSKMALGASGRSSIGVYANLMTMHNMVQQTRDEYGRRVPVQIMIPGNPALDIPPRPFTFTLGGFKSDGIMGRTETHDKARMVADVIAGRLSCATDNEKEQILGMIGVNGDTIGVDALLVALGYDQTTFEDNGTKHTFSIPWLLLSQPIIKDYVKLRSEKRGVTAGFTPDMENSIIRELVGDRYKLHQEGSEEDTQPLQEYDENEKQETYAAALTGKHLFDGLNGTPNPVVQQAALKLFLDLARYAKNLQQVQSRIAVQKDGLGKSIISMLDKYNNMWELGNNKWFKNIHSLIGTYHPEAEWMNDPERKKALLANGGLIYSTPGGTPYIIVPNTPTGHVVTQAYKAGKELWSDFFPYADPAVSEVIQKIYKQISRPDESDNRRLEKIYTIVEHMKMSLVSAPVLGLFKGDPQEDRYRLFIDNLHKDNPNMSLATYMSNLDKHKESPVVQRILENPLISQFTYDTKKNSSKRTGVKRGRSTKEEGANLYSQKLVGSYFYFNNARGSDLGDEHFYQSLVELMEQEDVITDKDGKAIQMNGKDYTTRMLGYDIIAATYLKGGIQKATEIVKYMPVPFLRKIGFASKAREWQAATLKSVTAKNPTTGLPSEVWETMLGKPVPGRDEYLNIWSFERQFAQHNPDLFRAVPKSHKDYKLIKNGAASFELEVEVDKTTDEVKEPPTFLHVKSGKDTTYIYERLGDTHTYYRIPTLGTGAKGLSSEYNNRALVATSIVNQNPDGLPYGHEETLPPPTGPVNKGADDPRTFSFGLETGNMGQILTNIQMTASKEFSTLAAALSPLIDNSVTITVGDIGRDRGTYDEATNHITIGKEFLETPLYTEDDIAQAILHEYIHSITSREISKYLNKDGSFVKGYDSGNIPAHITKLHRAFTKVAESVGQEEMDKFARRFNMKPELTSQRDKLLYAGYSIHEMLTMLSDRDFRSQLNGIAADPANPNSPTLLQRIADALRAIVEALGVPKGTLTAQTFEALLSVAHVNQENSLEAQRLKRQAELDKLFTAGRNTQGEAPPGGRPPSIIDAINAAAAQNSSAKDNLNKGGGNYGETKGPTTESFLPYISSEIEAAMINMEIC